MWFHGISKQAWVINNSQFKNVLPLSPNSSTGTREPMPRVFLPSCHWWVFPPKDFLCNTTCSVFCFYIKQLINHLNRPQLTPLTRCCLWTPVLAPSLMPSPLPYSWWIATRRQRRRHLIHMISQLRRTKHELGRNERRGHWRPVRREKHRNLIVMLIMSCVYIQKILKNTETNVFTAKTKGWI